MSRRRYRHLSLKQKKSLFLIGFLALSIPVGLYVANHLRSRVSAAPGIVVSTIDTPDNHTPELLTPSLAAGSTTEAYAALLEGQDQDMADTLTLTAYQLPPGLKLSNCTKGSTEAGFAAYSCHITGIPTRTGSYRTYVTLKDSKNASVQIRYQVDIKK